MVQAVEALEALAGAIDSRQMATVLTTTGSDAPALRVVNRAAPGLAEDIRADLGFFWWSWCERIGPVEQAGAVASRIASVLRS